LFSKQLDAYTLPQLDFGQSALLRTRGRWVQPIAEGNVTHVSFQSRFNDRRPGFLLRGDAFARNAGYGPLVPRVHNDMGVDQTSQLEVERRNVGVELRRHVVVPAAGEPVGAQRDERVGALLGHLQGEVFQQCGHLH
jgi:hypothetical protein